MDPFVFDERNAPFARGEPGARPHVRPGRPAVFVGVLLIPVAVCAFLMISVVRDWRAYLRLSDRGVETKALVVARDTVTHQSADGETGDPTHMIQYRFDTKDKRTFTRWQGVSWTDFQNKYEGTSVDVRYLEDDPETSRLSPLERPSVWNSAAALAGAVVPVVLAIFFGRSIRRSERLARAGRLVEGRVVACRLADDGDGARWVEVEYELTGDGPAGRGSGRFAESVLAGRPLPAAGTMVAICALEPGLVQLL